MRRSPELLALSDTISWVVMASMFLRSARDDLRENVQEQDQHDEHE
jgi:hypothetical protein